MVQVGFWAISLCPVIPLSSVTESEMHFIVSNQQDDDVLLCQINTFNYLSRNLGEGYRGTKTNLDKQCPPMVPAPLHWKPSLHTLHSLTHINIFQNTGLFRSCTLNPTGKRLTHLTIPLTVLPLRSASQTLRCPPPVQTQLISHQRPFILNWFTSSPYPSGEILFWFVSWKKRSSVTSLADFRIKMLH